MTDKDEIEILSAQVALLQMARREALAKAEAAERENKLLRSVVSKCADALGNGACISTDCTVEFMERLPSEIGLHVASLVEDRDTWKECADAAERDAHALREDAERYRWLRSRDLGTIAKGGIFIGVTPENLVVNFEDADRRIDAARSLVAPPPGTEEGK